VLVESERSSESFRVTNGFRSDLRTRPFVVVGIPAFNEEKTIARVVISSQEFADAVIVCDDGSTDYTARIAEGLGAQVIRHGRNLGYGAAIQSLFEQARESKADVLVTLDGDGQHEPSEIPRAIQPILEGKADVVIGSRFSGKNGNRTIAWYRRAGIRFLTKLTNGRASDSEVKDAQCGFRAYSVRSLERLELYEKGMGVSAEILMKARKEGLRVSEVACSCNYNVDGVDTSTHNPVRHGASVTASIIKLFIEDRPLIMLGIPALVLLGIGTIFGVWMLQIYAIEHHIVTNIALASAAFILIGFFMLSTGITLYAISRSAERTNSKR
jgi:glycosyltransferase involved in cell wall biosynthesis